jgi:pimeloyl-ACP methyl ester carboxylesterase
MSPSDSITSYVKTFYIQATRDKAIPAFVQDEYALRTVSGNRNDILKIDSDHIPHLSHPAELAQLLRDALSEIIKS